jgi:hypothetical protein
MVLLSQQLYEINFGWEPFNNVGTGDAFIYAMVKLAGPLPDRWEPYWDSKPFRKPDGVFPPVVIGQTKAAHWNRYASGRH